MLIGIIIGILITIVGVLLYDKFKPRKIEKLSEEEERKKALEKKLEEQKKEMEAMKEIFKEQKKEMETLNEGWKKYFNRRSK